MVNDTRATSGLRFPMELRPQEVYSHLFRAHGMGNLSPRYNIAPSQAVLVARNSEWGDYRQLATL